MSRLLQDLRYAVRSFTKAPGFTAVAIIVLALGIGANSATFTVVNALLFRPVPAQGEGIVGVFRYERSKPDSYRAFAYPNYVEVRDKNDVFDGLAAHTFSMAGVPAGDATRRIFVELVSSNYFDTLRIALATGRSFRPEEERPGANLPVVIVGYEKWRAAGFDPAFVGSTMKINSVDFTVVGVAPQGFGGTMALASPELWLPLGVFDTIVNDIFKNSGEGLGDRKAGTVIVLGRLKPGVTIEMASSRLETLSQQMAIESPDNRDQAISVNRLPRMSTSTSPQSDSGLGIAGAALMGLTGTVLLIACLNLANMLLARGTIRRKEIALRLALGGSRGRIVRQLLTESLLLAVVGALAGLVLAYWSTTFLVASLARVLPLTLVFESRPDLNVLLATAAFVGFATLLAGVGPAVKMSRLDLVTDLKEQASDTGTRPGRFTARNVLVVAQLALSLGLLCAGGLFARSAIKAASADPGFSYESGILAALDPSVAQMSEARGRDIYRAVLERVRTMPGIQGAAIASTVPFGNFHEGRFVERPGVPRDPQMYGPTYRIVSAGYFRSLNLQLLKGRDFTIAEEQSANAPRVAIIDTVLAKQLFPNEDPVGQTIRFTPREGESYGDGNLPMQIVGVAPTMREELMDQGEDAHVYVPFGPNYRAAMNLHVRTAGAHPAAVTALVETVRQELRAVDSRLPVLELTTLQRFHDNSLELWAIRTGGRMLVMFGSLALGLAVAGVYGVKSYLVSRRTREIGIRMALGANRGDVMGMVMRESAGLTLAGLAVGVPIALIMGRVLGSILYDVSGFDPLVFVAAPLVLAAASMFASYIPARRATRVNPLSALRAD
ncbi:MAG TPA: ABC transporter permease [Vicinamibacterales bacterium]|nr:ABC transporter permease [Vicinamibacterales bacterium]